MKKKLTTSFLIIEGGSQDADLRYLTGFSAPDPVVLVVAGRNKYLVVSMLEYGRAKTTARVTEVWTPQTLGLNGPERNRLDAWAMAAIRKAGVNKVIVGSFFPTAVTDRLRGNGIGVEVAEGKLIPERRKKSEREIRSIAVTQRAAVRAMRAAVEIIASSHPDPSGYLRWKGRRLRAEDVRQVIESTLLAGDCATPADTLVAGGVQAVDPHERGHGPLRAGWPIVIDIFPRHKETGYWGDITRTVVKGEPAKEASRMVKAVKEAHAAALSAIRSGVMVRRVHQAAQDVLQSYGFETMVKNGWWEGFIHSTGHGVGLDIHEAPSVNLSDTRLRAGDVVTVEPGLYYRRYGGVRIEDTILVEKDGYRILAKCPYRFQL